MHVLHLIHRYPPAVGGSEYFMAQASEYLAARGHHVTVLTTAARDLDHFWRRSAASFKPGVEIRNGVRVVRHRLIQFPLQRYVLHGLSKLPIAPWQCLTLFCNPLSPQLLAWSMRPRSRAAIVHAMCAPYSMIMYCAARIAAALHVPLVLSPCLHLGDLDDPADKTRKIYFSRPILYLLNRADLVFTQTGIEKRHIEASGVPGRRVQVLGNGVWPDLCTGGDPRRARRDWNVEADEVVVGHLANKSVEKGTIDLLRAAQLLWKRGLRFRVVLAGAEMMNFRRFWDGFGPKKRVVRLGVLSEAQKRDFYAGIDLFCMPSMSDSFGIVFLESWINGKAVVAYRSGGVPDVVRHGVDGLLATPHDIPQLADCVARLVTDRQLRGAYACAGRKRTLAEFLWEQKLAAVEEAYNRLIT